MNIQDNIVIISAEKSGDSTLNNIGRTDRLRGLISELHFSHGTFSGFDKVTQVRKGKFEDSYLVVLRTSDWENELSVLKDYALKNFNQDAIIFSDSNRNTVLQFENGDENIGQLIGVSKELAEKEDNYFFREIKENGSVVRTNYFITKKLN